jgi:hypothetical protein
MRMLDRIDPLNLKRRQWELWLLALAVVLIFLFPPECLEAQKVEAG